MFFRGHLSGEVFASSPSIAGFGVLRIVDNQSLELTYSEKVRMGSHSEIKKNHVWCRANPENENLVGLGKYRDRFFIQTWIPIETAVGIPEIGKLYV